MMATIQSIPVRQRHPSMTCSFVFNFRNHFGLKTRTSRLFTWCTRLQFIYFLVLSACVHFGVWPQLIRISAEETIESSLSVVNGSSKVLTSHEWTFAKRCPLSPTALAENVSSYMLMNVMNHLLFFAGVFWIAMAQSLFTNASAKYLENPYQWFLWCRKILLLSVVCSVCNQLASATTCRSMEILYDLRHIQLIGFFICLFAFFLGMKFASVKSVHRIQTRSHQL